MDFAFVMTPDLAARIVAGCLFGVMTLYCLHTGKRDNNLNRLLLAAVFGLLTVAAFAV